ncbi:MAG: hypothetical protein JWQ25_1588 [Daejeonella sp.]|nr:hypothetical protein [Daejeonella sp.]
MFDKIIIAGGSGFLGSSIRKRYYKTDTQVIVLSRSQHPDDENIKYVVWDAKSLGDWTSVLEGSTAVINLVGKSVNCRYTEKNKAEIISSRVLSTEVLGEAIQQSNNPPKVWINAGSAAIFGNSGDEIKEENSQVGNGFSPHVCKEWERAFNEFETLETRKVFLRIGMVLQKGGGIIEPFQNLAKFGLGGKMGSGNQYMTWIHEQDFLNIIDWAINDETAQGIIHCASPNPVTNSEFMKAIRTSVRAPFGFPNPSFLIKIGAVFIGTEAELVLSGRRVVSQVLRERNFLFKYPLLHDAMKQILN